MSRARVRRVNITLTEEIIGLIENAVIGGGYGSASEYVRVLIVREREKSGDGAAVKVNPKVPMGRPKAA